MQNDSDADSSLINMATINGTPSNDSLTGTSGDDTINPFLGDDIVDGGGGNDLVNLDYSAAATGIFYTDPFDAVAGSGVLGDSSGDRLRFSNIERFHIIGTAFDDVLRGVRGADTLNGGAGNDSISGNDGNDFLNGDDGDDTIDPGQGSDVVDGGAGSDVLAADYTANSKGIFYTAWDPVAGSGHFGTSDGRDTDYSNIERVNLIGTTLDDSLGASGADSIDGGAGFDKLTADYSAETLSLYLVPLVVDNLANGGVLQNIESFVSVKMGPGDDTINPGQGDDTVDGGPGSDVLAADFSSNSNSISYTAWDPAAGSGRFFTSDGRAITYSNIERVNLIGTGFNDDLRASGADSVDGGLGTDSLTIDYSAESVGFNLVAGAVNNLSNGGVLQNIESFRNVKMGFGNDTVNPGPGNDTVDGGAGTDVLAADFTGNSSGLSFTAWDPVAGTGKLQTSDGRAITYSSVERIDLTGTAFGDNLRGGNFADTLIGGAGNDTMTGVSGADLLDGGSGIDAMTGGAGDDTYVVDSASDVITENAGEGTDSVQSSITLTLGANLENLALTGTANINGTGNTLANAITGNS